MKRGILSAAVIGFLSLAPQQTLADCTDPAGATGELRWIDNTMRLCGAGGSLRWNTLLWYGGGAVADLYGLYSEERCKSDGIGGTDPLGYCDGGQRALVHGERDVLTINYLNDYDGGVLIGEDGPKGVRILANGSMGIGAAPRSGTRLDVVGSHIVMGADEAIGAVTRNNNTIKAFRLGIPQYNNAWPGLAVFSAWSHNGADIVAVGGGTQAFNAATEITFFTATDTNTLVGAERMRITGTGKVGIGLNNPAATLDLNGFFKLKTNTAAPALCNEAYKGSIALTSATRMCVCDGATWKEVNSSTNCAW